MWGDYKQQNNKAVYCRDLVRLTKLGYTVVSPAYRLGSEAALGFSKINTLDIKYSCLMQELRKVRNNLAHGGFNDREISEIIEFRKRWNPNSDLLNKDISKISFIDILKDICDNMEDIVEYAR